MKRVTSAMVLEMVEKLAKPEVNAQDLAMKLNICQQELSSYIRILETFGQITVEQSPQGTIVRLHE